MTRSLHGQNRHRPEVVYVCVVGMLATDVPLSYCRSERVRILND